MHPLPQSADELYRLTNLSLALKEWEKSSSCSENPLNLAWCACRAGQLDAALKLFRSAHRTRPLGGFDAAVAVALSRSLADDKWEWPFAQSFHAAVPFAVKENFLSSDEADHWLRIATTRASEFTEAGIGEVGKVDSKERSTLGLYGKQQNFGGLREHIRSRSGSLARQMNCELPTSFGIEAKLTRHGDGDFFRVHKDQAPSSKIPVRQFSYMIYLHHKPKQFSGGEFILFNTQLPQSIRQWRQYVRFSPDHNRIVTIRSEYYHAVAPVSLRHNEFENGRFALTGHLRQKPRVGTRT